MPAFQTFFTTLPVLLLVVFGAVLRKTSVITLATVHDLKNLVVKVSLPFLLFHAFATMKFEWNYLVIVLAMFSTCVAIYWLAGLQLIRKAGIPQSLAAGFEAGMIGYAVYTSLFGLENLSHFAVVDLGQVLFVFFILIPALEAGHGNLPGLKQTLVQFIRTPVIVAILVGLAVNLSGLYRYLAGIQFIEALFNSMNIVAGLTMPLVTIIIGYELNFNRSYIKPALRTVFVRLAVWLGLAWLFNTFIIRSWLGLDALFEAAVYLMVILPAPFVVPFYLNDPTPQEKDTILNTLSLGTLIALFGAMIIGILYN